MHWVVRHGPLLFIVPASHNGWNRRRPYKGHDPARMSSDALVDTGLPLGCGIPDSYKLTPITSE